MNTIYKQPTLTDCDREPIHQIGHIQPFGGLIALTPDWLVAHRSVNCADLLAIDSLPALGKPLSEIFPAHVIEMLREGVKKGIGDGGAERMFGVTLTNEGPKLDVAVHAHDGKMIIEFEPHDAEHYETHVKLVGPALASLDPIKEQHELFETAVSQVRSMLGYDRVMVYKFHADGSGEVVAEDRREDLEPYLGLRYPRSDIPEQARELYVRNRFRIISDAQGPTVPIEPATDINGKPLDLSLSVLRSNSPIHSQYLKNMGVAASLSISIVRQGKLWGLIACHHCEPRVLPYSLRTVAEMFSQVFSMVLDRMLIRHSEDLRTRGRDLHEQMMLRLAGGTSLSASLPMIDELLQDLIQHDGASILIDGAYFCRGNAPSEQEFISILPAMSASPVSSIVASAQLDGHLSEAAAFAHKVTGALIIPISRTPRDFLVLWREPLAKTVKWAGDPNKAITNDGGRLQPRESFAEWSETVMGRSEDWSEDEIVIAEGLRITLLEVILRMTDEVARERKRAQEQQELLIAELNHRVRNILNLIRSLVSQSRSDALSVSSFATIIGGRIAALATAHDNITRQNWSPAPLGALFQSEFEAYSSGKVDRYALKGEEVLIKPEAYTVLALVVHELVTNSAKYGSLVDSNGMIDVETEILRGGDLQIRWREFGGPPVQPPKSRGFGSTIIERSIPFELKGEADLRFKLSGVEADFLIPARYVEPVQQKTSPDASSEMLDEGSGGSDGASPFKPGADTLLPEHVLVVEDNMIIALEAEDNLKSLGAKKVRVESNCAGALAAISERCPDFAIVDFNLGTESSLPVTRELSRLGVPFVLATGYSEMADQLEEIGAVGIVRKPYGSEDIEAALTLYSGE